MEIDAGAGIGRHDRPTQFIIESLAALSRQQPETKREAQDICHAVHALLEDATDQRHAGTAEFVQDVVDILSIMATQPPRNPRNPGHDPVRQLGVAITGQLAYLCWQDEAFTAPGLTMLSLIGKVSKDWHIREAALANLESLTDTNYCDSALVDSAVAAIANYASDNADRDIRMAALQCLRDLAPHVKQARPALIRSAQDAAALETSADVLDFIYDTLSNVVHEFKDLDDAELQAIRAQFSKATRGRMLESTRYIAAEGLDYVTALLAERGHGLPPPGP